VVVEQAENLTTSFVTGFCAGAISLFIAHKVLLLI
jgi:hypothetical protein